MIKVQMKNKNQLIAFCQCLRFESIVNDGKVLVGILPGLQQHKYNTDCDSRENLACKYSKLPLFLLKLNKLTVVKL